MFLKLTSCPLTFLRSAKCQHLSSTHFAFILYLLLSLSLVFTFPNIPNACSVTNPLNEPPVRPHSNCVHVLVVLFVLFVVAMFVFIFFFSMLLLHSRTKLAERCLYTQDREKERKGESYFTFEHGLVFRVSIESLKFRLCT